MTRISSILAAAAAAGALLLAGCTAAPTAPSSAPSPAPSGTPTATPATPSAAPSPSSSAPADSAAPSADGDSVAVAPRCADAMAIDPEGSYPVSWQGSYEEQIAAADPQPGFEPAGLLDADGVLCSVVYDFPTHGPEAGVGRFSTALVRSEGALERMQAWALERGYRQLDPSSPEYILDGDGSFAARMLVHSVGETLFDDVPLAALERRSGLDLEPTDVLVTHADFQSDD